MKKWCLLVLVFVPVGLLAQTCGAPGVCLTWQASTTTGVTYNVYRATAAGQENYATPLNSAAITDLFFNDTTYVVGTTYFYVTCAVTTGGVLSPPSNEVQAQVYPNGAPCAVCLMAGDFVQEGDG